VNPSSRASGAYQFLPATWDATARRAGRYDLVGVPPNEATQRDQDAMAASLLAWQGHRPWAGPGC
jgi:muramidase (phage lysozyme)